MQSVIIDQAQESVSEPQVTPSSSQMMTLQQLSHLKQPQDKMVSELVVPQLMQTGRHRKSVQMKGMNWFLTYPQCEVSKEEALKNLLSAKSIEVKALMIAQEKHQDGNHHLHVALWLMKRVSVPPNYFDFVVGKHGNYLRMRSGYATVNYLMKEDSTPISHGAVPVPGSAIAKRQIKNKQAMKNGDGFPLKSSLSITITKAIQSGCSIREVHDIDPGYFLREKRKIEEYTTWWQSQQANTNRLPWNQLIYTGKDVNTKQIVDWLNLNIKKKRSFKQQQLYVSGPPNSRKTSLLLKLLERLRSYEVPEEDFYDLYPNPAPELIWMDEFKGRKTIQFLNLIAQGAPMTLRVKGSQRLKADNPAFIVLSNLQIEQVYHKVMEKNPQLVQALQSRFLEVVLTEPLDLDHIEWGSTVVQSAEEKENVDTPMNVVTAPVMQDTSRSVVSSTDQSTSIPSETVVPSDPATSVGQTAAQTVDDHLIVMDIGATVPTPTISSEEIDNHEYFARKMRQRRREKEVLDESPVLRRKSSRLVQKNKINFNK